MMQELGFTEVKPEDLQEQTLELWKTKSQGIRFMQALDLFGVHGVHPEEFIVSICSFSPHSAFSPARHFACHNMTRFCSSPLAPSCSSFCTLPYDRLFNVCTT